jgi:hypothetical protein
MRNGMPGTALRKEPVFFAPPGGHSSWRRKPESAPTIECTLGLADIASDVRANETEDVMKSYIGVSLAMLAGAALGATAVNGLHAQTKPGAYAVVDISEVTNPDLFKARNGVGSFEAF